MAKADEVLQTHAVNGDSSLDGSHGTSEDVKDMFELGRTQELKVGNRYGDSNASCPENCKDIMLTIMQRNFHSVSILGLICVIMCTWMGILL